ncbi:unnamed protein product [Rhizophagus irregularis]|uniref:Crinkler family protein n=1 Tax=Rhizophagus irregularis TaxID=588596 RepID=A0A915ZZS9_9GLOM|nr:unnamed protein product [Rhizophagus irregularis]
MMVSINCLLLGKTFFLDTFVVDVAKESNIHDENIHVIVQLPATGSLKTGKTIGEIIKEITKDLKERKPKSSYESNDMPLQQRDFREATAKITETAVANVEGKMGYSNYWCIVSAGAPGIGKTRFGIELFDYIKQNLEPPEEWGDVHFEYLYMNFRNNFYLSRYDSELKSEVIFGLRIAYAFFIEKKYDTTFLVFCSRALQYGEDIFIFDSVIYYCYESLKFSNNQKLFLYLHIDEFQLIDEWDAQNKTNQFFGNMIRGISKFMIGEYSTFIQPFLSGTATRAITKQKKATGISFQFVDCPLLDIKSMILIMDHFATKFKASTTLLNLEAPIKKGAARKGVAPKTKGVAPPTTKHVYKWKLCAPLLQLLIDTGGLPRALERLLDSDLQKMYAIYRQVYGDKELFMNLLYHCVEGIPVEENKRLDNRGTTVKDLQPEGHFSLSSYDGQDLFLIEMPFFFVCIYNDILKIVDVELMRKAFSVNNSFMYWQEWELFVAHHIAFRINLAIKMGKNELSLRNLHPGAYGTKENLDIVMKLKELGIYKSREQFPLNLNLTDNSDGSKIPWDNGHCVVVNGTSAEPRNIFYVMEDVSGVFYIIMCQNKKEKSRATFFLTRDINPNFWDINGLKNTIKGIGDDSINTVIAKRPYISEDHFHNVNPKADKRHKLDFFPFDIQGTEIYAPDHLIEN